MYGPQMPVLRRTDGYLGVGTFRAPHDAQTALAPTRDERSDAMITADGWLDWAERMPGPADKRYSQPNTSEGYVPHSAVGFLGGWLSRLYSTARTPDGRYTPYAAASVTGFIRYSGHVIQHYPFDVSCWASGNRHANCTFNAFENEGGYPDPDEPLTYEQLESNGRIIRDMIAWKPWTPRRPVGPADRYASLYEHHECIYLWGGSPTACPSRRFEGRGWEIICEEVDMLLREQVQRLQQAANHTAKEQAGQNDLLRGAYDAIAFQGKVLRSHEIGLVSLGSNPEDRQPPDDE